VSYARVQVLTVILSLGACSKNEAPQGHTSSTLPNAAEHSSGKFNSSTAALLKAMPDHAGDFVGGSVVIDTQFVRRSYQRGAVRISVTIAVPDATPIKYDEWVRQSAAFPQVQLDLAPNSGSGFYDCASGSLDKACNVHIQLRSGHHIEMMGEQAATGRQFDALLAVLPLRSLAGQ